MQIGDKGNTERRILHYWGRGYTEEIKEGDDYSTLPRMINIVVVDFNRSPRELIRSTINH
jgi:hypothetical protein